MNTEPRAVTYSELRALLRGEHFPLAFVDLDLLKHNARSLVVRASGLPIRLASKSIRCRAILRRVQALHPAFAGVLCYTAAEAVHLAEDGFDDLVVAYPTVDPVDVRKACEALQRGARITFMLDAEEHVRVLSEAARAHGIVVPVAIDMDMSSSLPKLHFGVRRSPIANAEDAVRLGASIAQHPELRLDGVMGYEAQIAGLQDNVPAQTAKNIVVRSLKRHSLRELRSRRQSIVRALREQGHTLRFVNGGGTGSLEATRSDSSVTELAAGSGLYAPVLFDGYRVFHALPAAGFVLPIVRRPRPSIYTCHGGGYAASGPAGRDRLPTPYLPAGASLLPLEGAGEVQTPVTYDGPETLSVGDPIAFRHAKAGELCEHFRELVLIGTGEDGQKAILDRVPTYRGDNACFL